MIDHPARIRILVIDAHGEAMLGADDAAGIGKVFAHLSE
jgi:hypothetical protein